MYDHKKKISWWMEADFVLRALILPGLILILVGGVFVFHRINLVETGAVVTKAESRCYANRSSWDRRSFLFRKTVAHPIDCNLIGTPIADDLMRQGFDLVERSQIWFVYRSPADDKQYQGFATVEAKNVSVGDKIGIKTSSKTPHSTQVLEM